MHLRQSGFIYSACGTFTKTKERIKKFKEKEIHQLDKACFQHDIDYGDFINWTRGTTASDKILRDKAFNIAKNPKYDGYGSGLASIVYKVFDKKSSGRFATLKLTCN